MCVKPQGVAVQGDPTAATLRYAVAYALPPDRYAALRCPASPQHCHRIDKMTGGLLVFSLTRSASALIGLAFAQHDDEHESSNGERAGEGMGVRLEKEGKAGGSRGGRRCGGRVVR